MLLDLLIIMLVSAELSFYTISPFESTKQRTFKRSIFSIIKLINYFCYRYGRSYSSHIDVYVRTIYDSNRSHLVTPLFHIFLPFFVFVPSNQKIQQPSHNISSSHDMLWTNRQLIFYFE